MRDHQNISIFTIFQVVIRFAGMRESVLYSRIKIRISILFILKPLYKVDSLFDARFGAGVYDPSFFL